MRSHHSIQSFLFIALVMVASAVTARANTCFGTVVTLADFISATSGGPGGGCTVGNIEYYNVQLGTISNGENPSTPASASQIGVTFSDVGFTLTGIPEVDSGSVSYLIGFNIDPAPVLTGDSISLDPPSGEVSLSAYYCSNQDQPNVNYSENNFYCGAAPTFNGSADSPVLNMEPVAILDTPNVDQSTSFSFFPGVTQAGVVLELTLTDDGPASIGSLGTDPSEAVPEPAAWLLVASGLALVTWHSKRARAKRLS